MYFLLHFLTNSYSRAINPLKNIGSSCLYFRASCQRNRRFVVCFSWLMRWRVCHLLASVFLLNRVYVTEWPSCVLETRFTSYEACFLFLFSVSRSQLVHRSEKSMPTEHALKPIQHQRNFDSFDFFLSQYRVREYRNIFLHLPLISKGKVKEKALIFKFIELSLFSSTYLSCFHGWFPSPKPLLAFQNFITYLIGRKNR